MHSNNYYYLQFYKTTFELLRYEVKKDTSSARTITTKLFILHGLFLQCDARPKIISISNSFSFNPPKNMKIGFRRYTARAFLGLNR